MRKTVLALLLLLGSLRMSSGIIPVVDESQIFQSIAMVKEAVLSNVTQAKELVNSTTQLLSLPTNVADEILGTIQQYYDVLNTGQALAYRASDAVRQFDALYASATASGNVPLLQRLAMMQQQVRDAGRVAAQTQSLYERLCAQQSTVTRLVAASQQAEGQKQVQQAQAQMQAVLSSQLSSLQELEAANGRLQMSVYMQDVIEREASQKRTQEWLSGYPTGVGEGFRLP
jgi:P-type conjugative transfer protein TrbJ